MFPAAHAWRAHRNFKRPPEITTWEPRAEASPKGADLAIESPRGAYSALLDA